MKRTLAIAMLVAVGAVTGAAANEANQHVAENFFEADADADGALTFKEFTRLIDLNADDGVGRARMIQRFGRYEMAFGRIDANADGIVTAEELQAMARSADR